VIGDRADRIAAEVRAATEEADFVIVTGGLGPTEDDVTRRGVAAAGDVPLVEDRAALKQIERFFQRRNREMSESNRGQALIPQGGGLFPNPIGTAPGFELIINGHPVFCLPGVPEEMRLLMKKYVLPRLSDGKGRKQARPARVRLHLAGITESSVNEQIKGLASLADLKVGITVHHSVITIQVSARDDGGAGRLEAAREDLRKIFGNRIFGEGTDNRIEEAVGRLLIEKGITFALAESCTGGLLGHMMTSVPGISDVFLEGTVAYSVDAKMRTLAVPEKLLQEHGQVSSQVARAMAQGAAERAGARAGIGITGIAGPGGGTPEKPVGTVHMAVFLDGALWDRRYMFGGDRNMIKRRSATLALDLLRRAVLGTL
jgi:nicotinamide-nucleotide amidase